MNPVVFIAKRPKHVIADKNSVISQGFELLGGVRECGIGAGMSDLDTHWARFREKSDQELCKITFLKPGLKKFLICQIYC